MSFGIGVRCEEDVGRVEKKTPITNETPCSVTIHFCFILSLYYG